MSWFNVYIKTEIIKDIDGQIWYLRYSPDHEKYKNAQREFNELEKNKGKFIPFYDDITGERISETELENIEYNKDSISVPMVITDEEELTKLSKMRKPRKYKTRIPIPIELREEILNERNGICERCATYHANQLHHINRDPSDNRKENLRLLCYDCHVIEDGRVKKIVRK